MKRVLGNEAKLKGGHSMIFFCWIWIGGFDPSFLGLLGNIDDEVSANVRCEDGISPTLVNANIVQSPLRAG